MGKMFSWFMVSFKALRPWQIAALAIAALGSAWATYGIISNTTSANQVDLTAYQRIIPVQYGDLMNQVSTNGSLIFPERETLTFGSAGTVSRVLVKEGQQVTQGQPLAELDHANGCPWVTCCPSLTRTRDTVPAEPKVRASLSGKIKLPLVDT